MMDILPHNLGYPGTADKKIIKMILRLEDGAITLNSGLELELFGPTHLRMLNSFEFDHHTRIISIHPTVDWIKNNDTVWDSLQQCESVNFNGPYADDLICGLVQRCKSVKNLSFTYFSAPNFANILGSISSPSLTELTAHVIGTNFVITFDALRKLGLRVGCSLRRMMLIFGDSYPGTDVGLEAHQIFGNAMADHSEGYLLFSGESTCCMQSLVTKFGYTRIGSISMVANSPYADAVVDDVLFERFYLFQKTIDSLTWIIGCKKKGLQHFHDPLPPMISSNDQIPRENLGIERFEVQVHDQQHVKIPMHEDVYGAFADVRDRVYPPKHFEDADPLSCCTPKNFGFQDPCPFSLPFWNTVRVTEVVYLLADTRYRLSNGLIVQLAEMPMERYFYQKVQAARRIIFTCTTQDRRWIDAIGLLEFLQHARQVDFYGWWFSIAQENILGRIGPECRVLSFMRLNSDRRPVRFLIRAVQPDIRTKISKFFYDSRDTIDDSLGSIYNGIVYQIDKNDNDCRTFQMLCSVFVMAKSVSGKFKHAKITFEHFVWGMVDLTVEDATITMVVEEAVSNVEKKCLEFGEAQPVMVPGMFSSRFNDPPWTRAMKQSISRFQNRTWYLIEPF